MVIADHGTGTRLCWEDGRHLHGSVEGGGWVRLPKELAWLPDLTDPATRGCLLALVQDAWDMPRSWVKWWPVSAPDMSGVDRSFCEVVDRTGRRVVPGPRVRHATEAEALVAALEAAPNSNTKGE